MLKTNSKMEYCLLPVLIISFLVAVNNAEELPPSEALQQQCGGYCFHVLKPMLEHLGVMQKIWTACEAEKLGETVSRIEKMEGQLATQEEKCVKQEMAIEENRLKLAQLGSSRKESTRKHPLFKQIGQKYYYIDNHTGVNWFQAVHKCAALGAHLFSPENAQEFQEVVAQLSPGGYWTDINDLANKSVFRSLTTGSDAKYLHWDAKEPNMAGEERCVHIRGKNFLMNDLNCYMNNWMICESSEA